MVCVCCSGVSKTCFSRLPLSGAGSVFTPIIVIIIIIIIVLTCKLGTLLIYKITLKQCLEDIIKPNPALCGGTCNMYFFFSFVFLFFL